MIIWNTHKKMPIEEPEERVRQRYDTPELDSTRDDGLEIQKRARGRPRIVRTGQRGRPRELHRTREIPNVSTEIIEQREKETNEESEETDQESVQAISNMAEIKAEDAMSGKVLSECKEAIKAEVRSLLKNNTFDIVDRLSTSKW